MKEEWVSPRIIIGIDATGNYYYNRNTIEELIWDEIKKGNNILLSAPRRVGKTSVMKAIAENPKKGYKLIFRDIEGVTSEENFYKEIYELILKCLSTFKGNKVLIKNYFNKIGITEVSLKSVKFKDKKLNYLDEINKIIPKLDNNGETVVLLIDELPEVLHSLHKAKKNESAISILKNLRSWRQENDFKKLKFVFAGSIGIHHVVNQIKGRSSDINDFKIIICPALAEGEFSKYISWATKTASINFNKESISYLKNKIKYFVPYFINIMIDEIDKIAKAKQNTIISIKYIDEAFELIVKNNDYFSDWNKRLKSYLSKSDYNFVNTILIHISHKDSISIQEIYDKAHGEIIVEDYMELVYNLEHDGYIYKTNEHFYFISPFLKTYWKRINPIYKG